MTEPTRSKLVYSANRVEEKRRALRELSPESTPEEIEWARRLYDESLYFMQVTLDFYKNNRKHKRD